MSETFYTILGIDEKSNKEEIKKAYRGLSLKYHPDKTNNDPELTSKYQKINEAYETLSDEQKKEEYDMKSTMGNINSFTNVDDIFSAIFGNSLDSFVEGINMGGGMNMGGMNMGGRMRGGGMGGIRMQGMPLGGQKIHVFSGNHPIHLNQGFGLNQAHPFSQAFSHPAFVQKPPSISKTIYIDLEQVLLGATVPVEIERWIIENDNKVFENETLYVTISKGIDDNEILILKEKGNYVNEHIKGDIKIIIKVNNNTIYNRIGLDLILDKSITLKESLCGFAFEIKYINNKIYTINNNSGNIISPEYKKIIPNMGLSRDEHIGNLIIIFHIEFPEKITEDQIIKLREIL